MHVYLLHHVRHAAFIDGRPTVHRGASGELEWDEQDGDDVKLLGVFSSQSRAEATVERARDWPGFREEPDCFLISSHLVDDGNEWAGGFVTQPSE